MVALSTACFFVFRGKIKSLVDDRLCWTKINIKNAVDKIKSSSRDEIAENIALKLEKTSFLKFGALIFTMIFFGYFPEHLTEIRPSISWLTLIIISSYFSLAFRKETMLVVATGILAMSVMFAFLPYMFLLSGQGGLLSSIAGNIASILGMRIPETMSNQDYIFWFDLPWILGFFLFFVLLLGTTVVVARLLILSMIGFVKILVEKVSPNPLIE
jgi:hypothetical protein